MFDRSKLCAASEPRPSEPIINTNTTAGVVEAVNSQKYGCQKTILSNTVTSSPVLVIKEDKVILTFFLYLKSGSFDNKKVFPPLCRSEVALGQAENTIKFISIEPQDLNINVSPMTELGSICKASSLSISEEEEEENYKEYHLQKNKFYESIDNLMTIYPKPTESLTEEEKNSVRIYRDYFYAKEEVEFLLPAYQALNPHFFKWIDFAISKN